MAFRGVQDGGVADAVVPIVAVLVVGLLLVVIDKTVPAERRSTADALFTAACSGGLMAMNSYLLGGASLPKAALFGLGTAMVAFLIRLVVRQWRARAASR